MQSEDYASNWTCTATHPALNEAVQTEAGFASSSEPTRNRLAGRFVVVRVDQKGQRARGTAG